MRFLLLGAFFIFCGNLSAQKKESTVFLKVQYGGQFPLLDDKNRFGPSLRPMMVLSKETKKKENVSSITGFFQFGTLVKESVFDHLLTPEGYLIGNDKNPAAIQLRQRAWFLGAGKGWRFVEKSNFLNRCALEVSAGFFQHKIRIQEDPQRLVPQISGEYKKGYDRLSSGPGLYVSWSFNPTANPTETRFVVGMDVFAAHTNHRRPVHFNTGLPDPSSFWVLQPGVHLGYHFKKVFKDPAAIKY
jgi:hypothetical protein